MFFSMYLMVKGTWWRIKWQWRAIITASIYFCIYYNFKLFLYSKMVLLTIVTNSNPHTLYFDHPIEKPSYIRLLSASIYNSWDNLKEEAVISTTAGSNGSTTKVNLLPGHYTIDSLVNEFNEVQKIKPNLKLTAIANTPVGSMTIFNQNNAKFSNNLLELLGIKNRVSRKRRPRKRRPRKQRPRKRRPRKRRPTT